MTLTKILNGLFLLPDKVKIQTLETLIGIIYITYQNKEYKIEYNYNWLSVAHSQATVLSYDKISREIKETILNQ